MTDDLYYRKLESTSTSDLVDMLREKDRRIAELEEENEGLKAFDSHYDEIEEDAKAIAKENAELKEQVENRNCSNCRRSKAGCPNDGSCHNFSLWQPFINPKLTKAKELIGELISSLSVVGECGKEECELLNRAEQFIKE